jgi:hypothetical protein
MAYDFYQGASLISLILPTLASNAVYYGLTFSGKVSSDTANIASTVSFHTTRAATVGLWTAACGFFASTVGSVAGKWVEHRTRDSIFSSKVQNHFKERLELFNEKAAADYELLNKISVNGMSVLAESLRSEIDPMVEGLYKLIANTEHPSFEMYKQLCHVEKMIESRHHLIHATPWLCEKQSQLAC